VDTLLDTVTTAGLADRIFNERQLDDILGGSNARRYGLVNRALKDGSLLRLKRGRYLLGTRYRSEPVHPFVVSQALVPGSYISFETALAYHGWIPEAVFTTSSVSPGRKTVSYDVPSLGGFSFHPLAVQHYRFLAGVNRAKFGGLTSLVAGPLRALMDLVALRKERWSGLAWVFEGMRIEETQLRSLHHKDFAALAQVYKHRAVIDFQVELERAITAMKAASQ